MVIAEIKKLFVQCFYPTSDYSEFLWSVAGVVSTGIFELGFRLKRLKDSIDESFLSNG